MLYKFCPVCGGDLLYQSTDGQTVPICQNKSCGFIFWQNAKPCVTVVIPNEQGKILLTVRAHEPEKGKLDLPGGFLHLDEHPDDGAKREIKEELGVEIEIIDHLGFVIDRYGEGGDYTFNVGIVAKIISGTPQAADDVASIAWYEPNKIPLAELSFTNNAKFIELWLTHRLSPRKIS